MIISASSLPDRDSYLSPRKSFPLSFITHSLCDRTMISLFFFKYKIVLIIAFPGPDPSNFPHNPRHVASVALRFQFYELQIALPLLISEGSMNNSNQNDLHILRYHEWNACQHRWCFSLEELMLHSFLFSTSIAKQGRHVTTDFMICLPDGAWYPRCFHHYPGNGMKLREEKDWDWGFPDLHRSW